MIDIHCHILPAFDDGSANLSESMTMARMAVSSGVSAIVATPHFPGEVSSLRRIKSLLDRFDRLEQQIMQENLPLKLHYGAEIRCLPETPQLAARHALPTIGNSNYLLTEFYFNEPASYMTQMLETLAELGYGIVLAHPERYMAVQQDPGLARLWFEQGFVLQLNKGSLLGAFGSRVQAASDLILSQGLAHVIASDAHGSDKRTPYMTPLVQLVEKRCGPEYAKILLERNPARIIEGREMVPIK